MANSLALTLPYPPSVNGYWRSVNGRQIISAKGREYRQRVRDLSLLIPNMPRPPLIARLRVTVTAYMPDKRRRDLDNVLKSLLDALGTIGIYEDDSQIDDLRVIRSGIDKEFPRVDVLIETMNGATE